MLLLTFGRRRYARRFSPCAPCIPSSPRSGRYWPCSSRAPCPAAASPRGPAACDRVCRRAAGVGRRLGQNGADRRARHRRPARSADRAVREERCLVGAAAHRRAVHPHRTRTPPGRAGLISGTEYAAPARRARLPAAATRSIHCHQPGGGVIAVADVKGTGGRRRGRRKTLTFSGYEWEVRDDSERPRRPNDYDSGERLGRRRRILHLKLAQRDGRWTQRGSRPHAHARLRHLRLHRQRHLATSIPPRRSACLRGTTRAPSRTTASSTSRSASGAIPASPNGAVRRPALLRAGERRAVLRAGRAR